MLKVELKSSEVAQSPQLRQLVSNACCSQCSYMMASSPMQLPVDSIMLDITMNEGPYAISMAIRSTRERSPACRALCRPRARLCSYQLNRQMTSPCVRKLNSSSNVVEQMFHSETIRLDILSTSVHAVNCRSGYASVMSTLLSCSEDLVS